MIASWRWEAFRVKLLEEDVLKKEVDERFRVRGGEGVVRISGRGRGGGGGHSSSEPEAGAVVVR